MDEERNEQDAQPSVLQGPGDRLRAAREAAGLGLAQIAAETRISERHLAMIEAGDFASLPARTYATGFTRSYARALGLDEEPILVDVRAVLATLEPLGHRRMEAAFEPGDPARIPSARLGWVMLVAALLLLAGGYAFYRSFFSPAGELPPIENLAEVVEGSETGPLESVTSDPAAPVVFTALEEGVWVKFYEASGPQLMQKQMAKGETYTIPADAQSPQLWTGRPDALAITIGGKPVPPLASREGVMRNVPVSAQALVSRENPPARQ